jgi:hypothetical protein
MKNTTKGLLIGVMLTMSMGTGYAISQQFNDYSSIPEWAKGAVQNMANRGVITGYQNGNFGPNDAVTRAQLATVLERYNDNYSVDYSRVLMNFKHLEDADLNYEVTTALALAISGAKKTEGPSKTNGYALGATCNFKDGNLQDYGMIKKITSSGVPKSYTVYNCEGDPHYGGGYYIHHLYTGGIPGSGGSGTIDAWYGPFAADILLSQ